MFPLLQGFCNVAGTSDPPASSGGEGRRICLNLALLNLFWLCFLPQPYSDDGNPSEKKKVMFILQWLGLTAVWQNFMHVADLGHMVYSKGFINPPASAGAVPGGAPQQGPAEEGPQRCGAGSQEPGGCDVGLAEPRYLTLCNKTTPTCDPQL